MAQTREKVLHYRRAEWLDDVPDGTTLESLLSQAHRKLKTVEDRSIVRDSGQCIRCVKKLEPRGGGIFVHITADTPGEQASVVPKVKRGIEETEVATASAPPDAEFMDGDAFLYVTENHVCMCSTGMRDGGIRHFLYEFFEKANLGDHATKFELLKVANVDKIKLLHAEGVKEIELRASMYQATAQYEKRKSQASGMLRSVARQVRSVLGGSDDAFDDSLRVNIKIYTDGRFQKHFSVGEKKIERLATDVIKNEEDYDDYIITTNTGQKIGPEEVYIKKVAPMTALGKSVRYTSAWENLEIFYKKLKRDGALEQ
jgi:predicted nucleic-acid-binding protein